MEKKRSFGAFTFDLNLNICRRINMRAHEILLEKAIEVRDDHGLIRNNRNNDYSIYKNVTAFAADFKQGKRNPWIGYVGITKDSELFELVKEYGWRRTGLGMSHDSYLPLARYKDERDAAYVGQKFAEDLEDNVMKVLSGEDWENIVGQIPTWVGEAPPLNHPERPKKIPEPTPIIPRTFDVEKATKVLTKLEGGRDRKASMKYRVNTDKLTGNYNLPDLLKIMKFFVVDKTMNYNDAAKAAALAFIELKKKGEME